MKNNIIIFRDKLLGYSETFIKKQVLAYKRYSPFIIGTKYIQGLELAGLHTITLKDLYFLPRIHELLFKLRIRLPKRLVKSIEKINPKLIHAHFGSDAYSIIPIIKKLNIPLITTFHGYDITVDDASTKHSHYIHRQFIKNRNELIECGSAFVAVSQYVKSKLLEKGFPENRVIVNYIGIDTDCFCPDASILRSKDVLFVGRLTEIKGCKFLLDAMSIVKKTIPHAVVHIVGKGVLENELKNYAIQQNINAVFYGACTPEFVKKIMNESKVFCVPSTKISNGCEEGFGLVFLEAQSMGMPVVSFNTGGIPEAVGHNETGILVNDKNVEGLASAITLLLTDKIVWETYSIKGRIRVKELFDHKKQVTQLEDLYEDVLQLNSDYKNHT